MFFNFESLPNSLMTLAQNMGLLLALTFVYSLLLPMRQRLSPRIQPIVMGLLFGLFAVLIMLNPVDLGGVRFDGRSIVVALACLYGGSLAGIISAGIVIPARFVIGGVGTLTAVWAVITVVALDLPGLFGGALFTETIFAWPGMGRLFYQHAQRVDFPVLMGIILINAALILLANLAADIAYAALDPRVRYE